MTVDEIFNKLASHMIEGTMYHYEMLQGYQFLYLDGYAKEQEYHFIEETNNYKKFAQYYIKHYYKLLSLENINRPKLIPETWYKYTTKAVDTGTKRNSIKELMNKWIEWEHSTKKLYQEMRQELYSIGEVDAAIYLDKYIEDVSEELSHAEHQLLMLETINYDIVQIIEWQEDLYKKYKKKSRW